MKKLYLLGLTIALISLLVLEGCGAYPFGRPVPGQPYSYGPGSSGPGMTGRGMGPGMMGRNWEGYNPDPNAKPITIDQAADAVQSYVKNYYNGQLVLAEVMDFAWNYYAEVEEKDTGIHAMELLIDKYSGRVYPEMGPNIMWNTKYSTMGGMMGNFGGGQATANMPVNAEKAKTLAQQYLDKNLPGLTANEADTFYGYYTLHTLKDGEIAGMLSVNGYTGSAWYHTWHGPFLGMKEYN